MRHQRTDRHRALIDSSDPKITAPGPAGTIVRPVKRPVIMSNVPSDLEIAQAASKEPIADIAAKLDIPTDKIIPYGHDKAKISYDFLESIADRPDGKLVLVTAISPTPAGEGKTTTTVGLGDGLNKIG